MIQFWMLMAAFCGVYAAILGGLRAGIETGASLALVGLVLAAIQPPPTRKN